jgi:hypothetical protein
MTPKLHRSVAALATAVVLAGGCSGSDDADSADTSAPTSTETVATDPPATDPPSTDPPPTDPPATDPPATDPPATDPPATDPPVTDPTTPEGEVEQAVEFFEQQWKECLRALPNCDVEAAAERTRGDVNGDTLSTATAFNANDYRAQNIEDLDYRVDAVALSDDGVTAIATVCVTDPVAIVEADGTPVDARFVTSVQEFGLEVRDGEWNWVTRTIVGDVGETEEDNQCA